MDTQQLEASEISELTEVRPSPVTYREGHFIIDVNNNLVWGGGMAGWVTFDRLRTIEPMVRTGSVYGSLNKFKNNLMPKWRGKYDPAGLMVVTAMDLYARVGVTMPSPVISVASSLLVSANIPVEVMEAKKVEHELFNDLLKLRQQRIGFKVKLEAANTVLAEYMVLVEQIKTTEASLVEAQHATLQLLATAD